MQISACMGTDCHQ